jgi:lysophospholipase L1-like esterase
VKRLLLILLFMPSATHKSIPSYLALGDSYTIGEAVEPGDRYPMQALRQLYPEGGYAPDIIATTGWTTGDLLRALPTTRPAAGYQAVSLLIGVNDQYQGRSQDEYREEFTTLLEKAIALAGGRPSHVIVLSIPDYSVTPFARNGDVARIAAEIDAFNAINYRISMTHGVHWLDVTAESRKAANDPSLVATDGLHFSGKEYSIWARLMSPVLSEILK